ncbi:MAG: hypothetical protein OEN20_12665, partial [Gammaproteobacteria bacterium]|nr:hypothetical protein [Gammaproteobacteria bacterium]
MDNTSDNLLTAPADAFDRLFARLRLHRRLRHVLRGLVAALAVVVLCFLTVALWMSVAHFEQASVTAGRYIAYACVLGSLAAFVLWPALRRIDDMQYALQTERQTPQLDGLLLSAVAVRRRDADASDASAELAEDVLRRTVHGDASTYRLTYQDDHASLRTAGLALSLLVALGVSLFFAPTWLQHGLRLLVLPLGDPAAGNPFYFDVSPGDAQSNAGEDQLIIASARGFSPET